MRQSQVYYNLMIVTFGRVYYKSEVVAAPADSY